MSERDSFTEWFHALAEHSSEALIGLAISEDIALLRLHVSRSTPDYPLPEKFEATEFAEAVTAHRENESESPWVSRELKSLRALSYEQKSNQFSPESEVILLVCPQNEILAELAQAPHDKRFILTPHGPHTTHPAAVTPWPQ